MKGDGVKCSAYEIGSERCGNQAIQFARQTANAFVTNHAWCEYHMLPDNYNPHYFKILTREEYIVYTIIEK